MQAPYGPISGLKDIRSTRSANSVNFGWFFIHLLITLSAQDKKELFQKYDTKFTFHNKVAPNYYCVHLSPTEFADFSSYKDLEIIQVPKQKLMSSFTPSSGTKVTLEKNNILPRKEPKYLVKASDDWKPSQFVARNFGFNYYLADGASYKQLLEDSDVLLFEELEDPQLYNLDSIPFMQSDSIDVFTQGNNILNKTVHDHNIKGQNQIISISDTSLDQDHNFFYDPDHEFPTNTINMEHRKVVRYDNYINKDSPVHGSHVSGIAAGKCYDDEGVASLFNGHAPEAKIYFAELNALLQTIGPELFCERMTELNSGVFTNSWGYPTSRDFTYLFDEMTYKYKNILTLFAAGNDCSKWSISSPADSKNVLTVVYIDHLMN